MSTIVELSTEGGTCAVDGRNDGCGGCPGDGASSGIGRASAEALAEVGFVVYATARRQESLAGLEKTGLRALRVDVTDEESMVMAVAEIEAEHGAVDLLVNNAGYGEMGPIEEVTLEGWRRQFETNVFGLVRMSQLVLPGMRRRGSGRIVNVGSMGGEFTFPFAGAYHASKYAVEAISDALRFEVAPFGIDVVLVQPAGVRTPLAEATVEALYPQAGSPYADALGAFSRVTRAGVEQRTGMEEPGRIAEVVLEVARADTPDTRYKVGAAAEQMVAARRSMQDRDWDAMLRQQYGLSEPTTAG